MTEKVFYELHELATDGIDMSIEKGWRKEQLRRLWILICISFTGIKGPGKRWRMTKCYQILRHRFRCVCSCDWISLLAGFCDSQVVGTMKNDTLKKDLLRTRDAALEQCKNWNQRVI